MNFIAITANKIPDFPNIHKIVKFVNIDNISHLAKFLGKYHKIYSVFSVTNIEDIWDKISKHYIDLTNNYKHNHEFSYNDLTENEILVNDFVNITMFFIYDFLYINRKYNISHPHYYYDEYIYLIRTVRYIQENKSIYKIGSSKRPNPMDRFNNYDMYPELYFLVAVDKCDNIESTIRKIFGKKYVSSIGNEYFQGNLYYMILDIINIITKISMDKPFLSDIKSISKIRQINNVDEDNTGKNIMTIISNHIEEHNILLQEYQKNTYVNFLEDTIIKSGENNVIRINDLRDKFTIWFVDKYNKNPPNKTEFRIYIESLLGRYPNRGWTGFQFG